jgi:2-dehydro-3-deoxyphosphogluconate aldolase/(4S)-4-hydroxy-2-oxoglutarate aldolase
MTSDFSALLSHRVIPVLVLNEPKKAKEIGNALVESGLPLVEVTLRTESAWESIEIFKSIAGLSVGVGSVTRLEQLTQASKLDLDFAVSPGMDLALVDTALSLGMPYLPGVATPSEMMQGLQRGLTYLKFFPAQTLGGIKAIQAMSAPFPSLKFVPTGGISEENAGEYLAEANVPAVGGSWMVSKKRISEGDFEGLRSDIRGAVQSVKGGQG